MIYHNYINPADAKPGDFLCAEYTGFYDLHLLVKALSIEGKEQNNWFFVIRFDGRQYKDEIIDGKPTSALIARFTGSSGKRFEAPDCTLIYRDGAIFEVGHIKVYNLNGKSSFYLSSDKIDTNSSFKEFNYETKRQAESERARLIAWLEEA